MPRHPSRRVAIVGSGVAGLTAAHVASRSPAGAAVTLYEADERLGGHADTHQVTESRPGGDVVLGIDTGFIVHNRRTYPVLLRMFAELGVATQDSEMSMSIRDDDSGLEWAGALGRKGVFPTRDNLTRPAYLRMLTEIPRFHRMARAALAEVSTSSTNEGDTTLREFIADGGFTAYFTRHFMEPVVAAVWSCDPEVALDYPARYLFAFLEHHGMLSIFGSPTWRTVTGGSHEYVRRVAAGIAEVRTGSKVTSVLETPSCVEVTDGNGQTETYDAVVIATHPGQALTMLAEPGDLHRELLGAMPYSASTALLHTDTSLLPRAENARASWNFLRPGSRQARPAEEEGVTVTYDLTRLQRLETDTHYLVTLGGEHLVDPATVIDRMEYEHPLYNPTSVAAQTRLSELNTERVAFAGAYHGWGFHEDGARSGLAAVEHLGFSWSTEEDVAATVPTGIYDTTISHIRRKPFGRTFTNRSRTWLVDLDDLPDHGRLAPVLGSFEARDHLGDPARSIRTNVESFLAQEEGIDLQGGRIVMAAHPRAWGYCFNPISVFWCFSAAGAPLATVVEVHNTYGDRHAYLVHPDEQGRATTPKAMYVSPFHGTDGVYDLAVPAPTPLPTGRLRIVVSLRTDDDAVFSACLTGNRASGGDRRDGWRAAPSALVGSLLIRVHGVVLWARRLPVRPRPNHSQEGVR